MAVELPTLLKVHLANTAQLPPVQDVYNGFTRVMKIKRYELIGIKCFNMKSHVQKKIMSINCIANLENPAEILVICIAD